MEKGFTNLYLQLASKFAKRIWPFFRTSYEDMICRTCIPNDTAVFLDIILIMLKDSFVRGTCMPCMSLLSCKNRILLNIFWVLFFALSMLILELNLIFGHIFSLELQEGEAQKIKQ